MGGGSVTTVTGICRTLFRVFPLSRVSPGACRAPCLSVQSPDSQEKGTGSSSFTLQCLYLHISQTQPKQQQNGTNMVILALLWGKICPDFVFLTISPSHQDWYDPWKNFSLIPVIPQSSLFEHRIFFRFMSADLLISVFPFALAQFVQSCSYDYCFQLEQNVCSRLFFWGRIDSPGYRKDSPVILRSNLLCG